MMFAYEDLSDDQFESLVILICQRLFGIGTQGFAKGPDGGRDAKFSGTAELHPSKTDPWKGTVIIQAKHTNGYNRSFSESDFYNPSKNSTVLGDEIPRIQRLRKAGELDHYFLFSNRRLTGNSEAAIREYLSTECDIPLQSIYLCGIEQLELYLKHFPEVAKMANLDPIDSPLIVSSDELAEVVEALASNLNIQKDFIDIPPVPRVDYQKKNTINNMTPDYANEIRRKYLKETVQIQKFLAAPENIELMHKYELLVDEFQLKIIAKRKNYQSFDEVIEYLIDLLFMRDPVLRKNKHKRLTRAIIFFMYWNCDIGRKEDGAS